jgi:hypothetical protein
MTRLTQSVILQPSFAALQKVHSFISSVRSSRQQLSAGPLPRLRPQPRPPPQINTERTRCGWPCTRRPGSGRRWRQEIKMAQKDSVKASRPCASFTTIRSPGSSCPPASFNSLITLAANLRASSSFCRIVPSVLSYVRNLSRYVTTKWYRGKCAPLVCQQKCRLNNWVIIGSYLVLPRCERFTRPSSFWL